MDTFFDYFQIAAITLLFLLIAGRAMYLLIRNNVNPIVLGLGKRGLQRILELGFLLGMLVWMMTVFSYTFYQPISSVPLHMHLIDWMPAKILGVGLVIAGFILFIMALVSFGSSWRIGIDEQQPGELVTTGIFAFSRNPIFVFIGLYFIGTFLINGTLFFLAAAALAVGGIHHQILQEERFLAKAYGQAYQDYRARTGRYFTWRALH